MRRYAAGLRQSVSVGDPTGGGGPLDQTEFSREMLLAEIERCEGCGGPTTRETVRWYGRWLLCVRCKSRSVVTGWLPEDAEPAARDEHDGRREALRSQC